MSTIHESQNSRQSLPLPSDDDDDDGDDGDNGDNDDDDDDDGDDDDDDDDDEGDFTQDERWSSSTSRPCSSSGGSSSPRWLSELS